MNCLPVLPILPNDPLDLYYKHQFQSSLPQLLTTEHSSLPWHLGLVSMQRHLTEGIHSSLCHQQIDSTIKSHAPTWQLAAQPDLRPQAVGFCPWDTALAYSYCVSLRLSPQTVTLS